MQWLCRAMSNLSLSVVDYYIDLIDSLKSVTKILARSKIIGTHFSDSFKSYKTRDLLF